MASKNKIVANAMSANARNKWSTSPHIKVEGWGYLDEMDVEPKIVVSEYFEDEAVQYAKDGVSEIAGWDLKGLQALTKYDARANKLVAAIMACKQALPALRKL